MIISSAAHFVVCECGGHGYIVTAAGNSSFQFCSKARARLALDDSAQKGMIADYEVGEVLRQINASRLDEREEDAAVELQLMMELMNALVETLPREGMAESPFYVTVH